VLATGARGAEDPADPVARLHDGQPPVWFDDRGLTSAARSLLREMMLCGRRGLDPLDYGAEELLRVADGLAPPDASPRAGLDRAISTAALRFLRHLTRGRIEPATAGYLIPLPPDRTDRVDELRRLAAGADVPALLDGHEPGFVHFGLLKQSLARYRVLAAEEGEWGPLPPLPGGRSLRAGEAWAGLAELRRRLRRLGDLPAGATDAPVYDEATVAAVTAFQARHGLDADGVVGRGTVAALEVPLSHRVAQIEWTMERARWLPRPEGPFILVNIPQFRLFAFAGARDEEAVMTPMRVVVGRAYEQTRTPIFTELMRYVVLRPYWDVPRSIAVRELLPDLRRDPGYAARNGYELVRGQGDASPVVPVSADSIEALARGELRIRQRPGRQNALGRVKFMLPNAYNVYLHDTPSRSLFGLSRRAFSHGCIRVEEPLELAKFVLAGRPEWTAERLESEMSKEGGPLRIDLPSPLRVMIVYATAIALEDGRTLFFDDVYGHDARLAALEQRRAERLSLPST
jgi:murein L,D-transpeptidase YcbB/YkuD